MATTPDQNEARLAVVESKVADLAGDHARVEAMVIDGNRRLEAKIDKLTADYLRRPSWTVASFIGILSTLCGSLLVALATQT